MLLEEETFESELGDVTVGLEGIRRDVDHSEKWEEIEEEFSEDVIVNSIRFSSLEDLDFDPEADFPNIQLKIDGVWRKMFFSDRDNVLDCFKRLIYMWTAHRQNHH